MKGKLLAILVLSSILFCWGCSDVHVFVQNTTLDNFRINEGGVHVKPGEKKFVFTLNGDFFTDGFDICRSYGCLARVTVTLTKSPELEDSWGKREYDTVTITENPRDTFQASGGTWTTASVEHY